MTHSAASWNSRYLADPNAASFEPSAILAQLLPLLPRGHALDLACGAGRNAIFLATRGWGVTAIDGSRVALDQAKAAARSHGIETSSIEPPISPPAPPAPRSGRVHLIEADLETFQLPREQFHLIVCIHYLQRSAFPAIEEGLVPGGVLLYETFTRAQLQFPSGPRNPEHLLETGELRAAFPTLTTIFFRELCAGKGIATLLSRKGPGRAAGLTAA